ncbi:MAG: GspE/PulE family protein [Patescibacteria group bacterium]
MSINQTVLGKLIEKNKLVSKTDLAFAIKTSRHLGCSFIDILLGRDLIKEEDLGKILAHYFKVKFVNLKKIHITGSVLRLIPENLAIERGIIAFAQKDKKLSLAMEDPKDLELIENVKKTVGFGIEIVPFVATKDGIKQALKLYKKREERKEKDLVQIKGVSAVSTVEQLLEEAIREEASDIHFEPLSDQLLVRFRVDGVLHDQSSYAKEMNSSIVARIKILSDLKLDEQRLPQDGQFSFQSKRRDKVSLRVSIIPTIYGEKVVLRILQTSVTKFNLEELGLLPEDQGISGRILERTHGMILVTGPTGSGKTTTLYTILNLINKPDVNIITIEDPVENRINRVNQIQVNSLINLSFANGLRSILRQDPDIVMVGEIRDKETAVIAVNAAMTGHLVFSSVHANTSAGAIPRMLNLGAEPFLLASTINMVVAQRLVRVLCPKCKEKILINPILKKRIAEAKTQVLPSIRKTIKNNFQAKGCSNCYHTGFRGRVGIFELLSVDDDIKKMIISKASSNTIWAMARKKGTKSMLEDGLIKVAKGITTIEEVFRVISE